MSRFLVQAVALATGMALVAAGQSSAFNYVSDSNGTFWGFQDVAPPRVDTGSIRATQIGAGQNPAYSTTINGYGGIKVWVSTAPRFNGELMRGFGLTFDGVDRFKTTAAVALGGVEITRGVYVKKDVAAGQASWSRWLDTFRNTTGAPITVKVAFGGQTGYSPSGANSSAMVNTSSGDAAVSAADTWAEVATPLNGTTLVGGPQATVIGTPAPFGGAMTFTGNWLHDTFDNPLAYGGHEGNFQAYVNTLTLAPGAVKSLLHYVVLGQRVSAATSARGAAEGRGDGVDAGGHAGPDGRDRRRGVQRGQLLGVAVHGLGFDPADRRARAGQARDDVGLRRGREDDRADARRHGVRPDDLAGDHARLPGPHQGLRPGPVRVQRVRDRGRRRDGAGAQGRRGARGGEADARPRHPDRDQEPLRHQGHGDDERLADVRRLPARSDAFQVAKLREAGAVIIGKAALEEYATSGNYSNDPWGQVWNAFQPSKSAIASSGGSATAVAANLAAGALGSQTGDSLYGPASGASLVTLRGTDGLESGTGIMPLSWLTDFGGVMTRSVGDLADMLNVVTGTDPADPATAPADAERPADWRSTLDSNALRGKRIGYIPSVWEDPFGTTGTVAASKAALKYLTDAGATIVEMGATVGDTNTPPTPGATPPGDTNQEGWMQYIDAHPELAEQGFTIRSAVDVSCSQKKVSYVRADPSACAVAPAARMTPAQIVARRGYRDAYKATTKTWLDTAGADDKGVDAVVYPGLLSDISLNDGGGGKASFGRRDTPGAGPGVPTVVFPAGRNDHGQPINLQLLGRAWDDDKLVGMAYAFEQLANADGNGHQLAGTAPALKVVAETGGTVGASVPATLSLTLGAPASFGAFTPGIDKDYTASTSANVISTAGDAALTVSGPGVLDERLVHAAVAAGGDVQPRRAGPRRCPTTR